MSAIDITNVTPFALSLPAAGIGVVVLAQAVKKVFGMDNDTFIHFMVILVSIAATLASYVLQYKNLPPVVLGVSGPAIYGFSQGLYKTAKALNDLLPTVAARLHKQPAPAAAIADQAVAAVDVPAEIAADPGTPVAEPPAPESNGEFNF